MTGEGKKALITGGARGIGRACALELAQCGLVVAIASRSEDELEKAKVDIESTGASCFTFKADLSRTSCLEEFHNQVADTMGAVDILVNNAGIYRTNSLDDNEGDHWRSTMEINLDAPYFLSRLTAKKMKEKGWGRIVNISSISGTRAEAFGTAYSASKFGLLGVTESLALELAPYGVTVNAVCPGWVKTEMAFGQLEDPHWCKLNNIDPQQSIEIAELSTPQKRLLEAEEIASLVSFLASEKARGITGQSINICGGLSIT